MFTSAIVFTPCASRLSNTVYVPATTANEVNLRLITDVVFAFPQPLSSPAKPSANRHMVKIVVPVIVGVLLLLTGLALLLLTRRRQERWRWYQATGTEKIKRPRRSSPTLPKMSELSRGPRQPLGPRPAPASNHVPLSSRLSRPLPPLPQPLPQPRPSSAMEEEPEMHNPPPLPKGQRQARPSVVAIIPRPPAYDGGTAPAELEGNRPREEANHQRWDSTSKVHPVFRMHPTIVPLEGCVSPSTPPDMARQGTWDTLSPVWTPSETLKVLPLTIKTDARPGHNREFDI